MKSVQDLVEDEEAETAIHPQYEADDQKLLRQPLSDVDRNSQRKSPQRSSKTSSYDSESTQLDRQLGTNMERGSLDDIDLEFNDEDIFTSTAAR